MWIFVPTLSTFVVTGDEESVSKNSKKDKEDYVKVQNQSLSLNMSEWVNFRDKAPEILHYGTLLDMGNRPSRRPSGRSQPN